MAKIYYQKSKPFTPEQMFNLVNDVASYPEFIPDCSDAGIIKREESVITAYLEVEKLGFKKKFSTRNELSYPNEIQLSLLNGPFKSLEGKWQFRQLDDTFTEITFTLDFEFNNKLLDLTFSAIFKDIIANMVEAFTQRAHQIYNEQPLMNP